MDVLPKMRLLQSICDKTKDCGFYLMFCCYQCHARFQQVDMVVVHVTNCKYISEDNKFPAARPIDDKSSIPIIPDYPLVESSNISVKDAINNTSNAQKNSNIELPVPVNNAICAFIKESENGFHNRLIKLENEVSASSSSRVQDEQLKNLNNDVGVNDDKAALSPGVSSREHDVDNANLIKIEDNVSMFSSTRVADKHCDRSSVSLHVPKSDGIPEHIDNDVVIIDDKETLSAVIEIDDDDDDVASPSSARPVDEQSDKIQHSPNTYSVTKNIDDNILLIPEKRPLSPVLSTDAHEDSNSSLDMECEDVAHTQDTSSDDELVHSNTELELSDFDFLNSDIHAMRMGCLTDTNDITQRDTNYAAVSADIDNEEPKSLHQDNGPSEYVKPIVTMKTEHTDEVSLTVRENRPLSVFEHDNNETTCAERPRMSSHKQTKHSFIEHHSSVTSTSTTENTPIASTGTTKFPAKILLTTITKSVGLESTHFNTITAVPSSSNSVSRGFLSSSSVASQLVYSKNISSSTDKMGSLASVFPVELQRDTSYLVNSWKELRPLKPAPALINKQNSITQRTKHARKQLLKSSCTEPSISASDLLIPLLVRVRGNTEQQLAQIKPITMEQNIAGSVLTPKNASETLNPNTRQISGNVNNISTNTTNNTIPVGSIALDSSTFGNIFNSPVIGQPMATSVDNTISGSSQSAHCLTSQEGIGLTKVSKTITQSSVTTFVDNNGNISAMSDGAVISTATTTAHVCGSAISSPLGGTSTLVTPTLIQPMVTHTVQLNTCNSAPTLQCTTGSPLSSHMQNVGLLPIAGAPVQYLHSHNVTAGPSVPQQNANQLPYFILPNQLPQGLTDFTSVAQPLQSGTPHSTSITGSGAIIAQPLYSSVIPALPQTTPALPHTIPALPNTIPALPQTIASFPGLPTTIGQPITIAPLGLPTVGQTIPSAPLFNTVNLISAQSQSLNTLFSNVSQTITQSTHAGTQDLKCVKASGSTPAKLLYSGSVMPVLPQTIASASSGPQTTIDQPITIASAGLSTIGQTIPSAPLLNPVNVASSQLKPPANSQLPNTLLSQLAVLNQTSVVHSSKNGKPQPRFLLPKQLQPAVIIDTRIRHRNKSGTQLTVCQTRSAPTCSVSQTLCRSTNSTVPKTIASSTAMSQITGETISAVGHPIPSVPLLNQVNVISSPGQTQSSLTLMPKLLLNENIVLCSSDMLNFVSPELGTQMFLATQVYGRDLQQINSLTNSVNSKKKTQPILQRTDQMQKKVKLNVGTPFKLGSRKSSRHKRAVISEFRGVSGDGLESSDIDSDQDDSIEDEDYTSLKRKWRH